MDIIDKSENKIERPDFASYYREKYLYKYIIYMSSCNKCGKPKKDYFSDSRDAIGNVMSDRDARDLIHDYIQPTLQKSMHIDALLHWFKQINGYTDTDIEDIENIVFSDYLDDFMAFIEKIPLSERKRVHKLQVPNGLKYPDTYSIESDDDENGVYASDGNLHLYYGGEYLMVKDAYLYGVHELIMDILPQFPNLTEIIFEDVSEGEWKSVYNNATIDQLMAPGIRNMFPSINLEYGSTSAL
jgi:hypothetical protein